MKTYKILSSAFLFSVSVLNAQEIQNRSITPFNKIEVHGSVNLVYTTSDSVSLSVKAKNNEIDNVQTRVENGTLIVSNKGNFSMPVYVYVKNSHLNQVQASGAAVFKTMNAIKEDSVFFSASSSANVTAMVTTVKVKSVQSGASFLTLSGTTDKFLAELSGASSLKAYGLVAKTTDILATGASSSKIYVTDKLRASASGASNIKVKGEVTDISAEATSASSISKIANNGKNNVQDSTVYNWKGKKIIIIDKDDEGVSVKKKHDSDNDDFKHWSGFSAGVNGYMNKAGSISVVDKYPYMDLDYARSFNFQLNLIERQFNIVKNNFKIITGFGFDYHSYAFAGKTNLNPDSSFTYGTMDTSHTYVYKKNKLRNTYLQVPILFEFNTSNNPDKTFHFAFGVIGQYLVASRTKQELETEKFEFTKVRKDSYNMSPFSAKAHVNMGYKGWTVFGEYSLTPLFQSGKGPELYPFTAGIRIIPFT